MIHVHRYLRGWLSSTLIAGWAQQDQIIAFILAILSLNIPSSLCIRHEPDS